MTEEGRRLLAAATERPWELDGDNIYSPHGIDVAEQLVGNAGDAALIVAAVNQYAALLDLAEEVSRTQAAAVEMFRRNGIVFDKWPPEVIPPERWNTETLAALDPEVRWQGIAFSLYTDLCQLASHADAAIPPSRDSTPDPLE